MLRYRFCNIALTAIVLTIAEAQLGAAQQPRNLLPPPSPPPNIDPQPGPFIIKVDENGEVAGHQRGVVANAVHQWSGEKLQAFSICFTPAERPFDWNVVFKSIEWVANELKAHDAKSVVMPAGWLCEQGFSRSSRLGSYVTIIGVVRP